MNIIKFQLVFQFENDDFDTLMAIEEALIEGVDSSEDVDGHDIGCGQSNIFVITDDPTRTFQDAHKILEARGLLPMTFKVATRSLDGNEYTVLWPRGTSQFRIA